MKGFLTYTLICDTPDCDERFEVTRHITALVPLSKVVAKARECGWKVEQRTEKHCYCPECSKNRKR